MAVYAGTVADVASGELVVGYTHPWALKSDSEIDGTEVVKSKATGIHQLKVVRASRGRVVVSSVNLDEAFRVIQNDPRMRDPYEVEAQMTATEKFHLAQNLKSGSVLVVS